MNIKDKPKKPVELLRSLPIGESYDFDYANAGNIRNLCNYLRKRDSIEFETARIGKLIRVWRVE